MQQQSIPAKKTILWLATYYILSDLIAFALGVGYLLIVVGFHGVTRLAIIYYRPFRNEFFRRLGKDSSFVFPSPDMTWWRVISISFRLIVSMAAIGFGIWILLHNTFLEQNLIYRFLER